MTQRSSRLGRLRDAVTSRCTCLQGDRDRGSVTAYLLIMTVALVVLAGLVLDGGAALAAQPIPLNRRPAPVPTPSTTNRSGPPPWAG